jgi:hypothetical protein
MIRSLRPVEWTCSAYGLVGPQFSFARLDLTDYLAHPPFNKWPVGAREHQIATRGGPGARDAHLTHLDERFLRRKRHVNVALVVATVGGNLSVGIGDD